jgi:hypothetical protein
LFDAVIEYPIAIALACWLCIRPTLRHARWEDALLPLLLIAVYAGAPTIGERIGVGSDDGWGLALRYGLAPLVCLAFITRPLRFQLGAVALLVLPYLDFFDRFQVLHQERTFFGVHRVTREPDGSGAWHRLWHGVTTHGMQYDEAPWNEIATTYFALSSPIGDVMGVLAARGGRRHIAVVGLGAGTLASYGRADWDMTFYEIDPAVVRIARNPRLFTFVESSKSPVGMVLGDARQRILTAEAGAYDLIALDAFSSDAVPVHLLTREALQAYLERLAPEGVMTFNVTNWYLDLAPIIAATARDLGLVARLRRDREITDDERRNKKQYSDYVVVARSEADLGPIAGDERWGEIEVPARLRVWNDDYSNILSALRSD